MANNTPAYQGPGSPVARNGVGWLGRIGHFFGGGGTPMYFGDGQPSSGSSGIFLGGSTPVYKPAPVPKPPTESTSTESASTEQPAMAQAMTGCPVDLDPFGSGPIAIIVPRPGF
jgi:hypothetical protein